MTEQAMKDYPEKILATHTRVMTRDNAARCSCGWAREADWSGPGWAASTEFQKHLLGLALAAGWDAGPWASTVKNPFVSVYNTRVEATTGPELPLTPGEEANHA